MKEIPLLFTKENRDLVRRRLKTETRRGMGSCPIEGAGEFRVSQWGHWTFYPTDGISVTPRNPYGLPQSEPIRYWMREPVKILSLGTTGSGGTGSLTADVLYLDDDTQAAIKISHADYERIISRKDWRRPTTAMHMLRSFTRTWLNGVKVWPEKLGDMSEESAIAEGCERFDDGLWRCYGNCPDHKTGHDKRTSGQASYMSLWDSTNGKGSWQPDKWTWAIKFQPPGGSNETA